MTRVRFLATFAALLAFALAVPTAAHATDVARIALQTSTLAKPNVIFGMDDSGSMGYEMLLSGTNDGAFWWDPRSQSMTGWKKGLPIFGNSTSDGTTYPKYVYLFPNGCNPTAGHRVYCDYSGNGSFAVAPTAQMASLRASAYNPLYYDPAKTYAPWLPGTIRGSVQTFAAADPAAPRTDPLLTVTFAALNADLVSRQSNNTFHMVGGMVVPAGASVTPNATVGNPTWSAVATAFTVPAGASYDASISYYPATYWVPGPCTVDDDSCTRAPDGATLQRYQIRPGATFPSGRGYADELQNFANWFTYYRNRQLMLGASMGQVMASLSGMRVGVVNFNSLSPVTMYDTDSTDPTGNGSVLSGRFYGNRGISGTPTRETLKYIGDQFRTNNNVITTSCQRNAAVIVTDGFAYADTVTPPGYNATTYGSGPPYATTWPSTLADIALSYYTNTLRTDLPAGHVRAAAPDDPNPASDKNPNLHMNTYAVTLGANGNLWPARASAYGKPAIAWPNPTDDRSPVSIDDLWHASVNGRGFMLQATTPEQTAAAMQSVLADILKAAGAQSSVAFSSPNLIAGDSVAYTGLYRPIGWSGDIKALPVDIATGTVGDTALWSADAMLNARSWSTRQVFSYDGSGGTTFTAATVGGRVNPGGTFGATPPLIDFLRGDRSAEGTSYRKRTGLMGGVINAEPVIDKTQGIVFGTTNEGMLHAFDSAIGAELWAYVPGFTHAGIGAQSRKTWSFQTLLDGTPTLADAGSRRLLVGGAGTAGPGYYALDVAASHDLSESTMAGRVLWEFPNASSVSSLSSNAQVRAAVGASVGKPLVLRTARYGWVALVTSGYNSTLDGKGRLFVLDAVTGAVQAELVTTAGTLASRNGDAGLAQVSAYLEADGTARYVYGGDLLGNLWRFDIDTGSVLKLATLTDAAGTALPITAVPELGTESRRRMVFIGTGRLLGTSDFDDSSVNSMFAIWDNDTPVSTPRQQLAVRTMAIAGNLRHVAGTPVDWTTQRGWYVDLPAGEKANTDPSLAFGVVSWSTNHPSLTSCSSSSALYVAVAASGLELPPAMFPGDAFYATTLTSALASRASFARLSDGSMIDATQQSDASTTNHRLLVQTTVHPRKNVWREIRR